MELGLSLGDASKSLSFLKEKQNTSKKSGFDFLLGLTSKNNESGKAQKFIDNDKDNDGADEDSDDRSDDNQETQTPLQLNLLPLASRLCSSDNGSSENGSSANMGMPAAKGLDVNRTPAAEEVSSANSIGSPFQMEFSMYGSNPPLAGNKREFEAAGNDNAEAERGSDDEDNGVNARKKLRLSKEQSAFLEESFKEHNTLNPQKQKLALAKQLNLRPRQVEVWFQNRRARTKLKQTEVDCEYLKRCCDTLTEENRRLHKELQELRALKSSNPFYMQSPATTLTMCPSCERVSTTSAAAPPTVTLAKTAAVESMSNRIPFPLTRPRFYPFQQTPTHSNQPAAS